MKIYPFNSTFSTNPPAGAGMLQRAFRRCHTKISYISFLDASSHLYNRVCPSVGRSVRPSVRRSAGHAFVKNGKIDTVTSSYNHFVIVSTHRWPYGPYFKALLFSISSGIGRNWSHYWSSKLGDMERLIGPSKTCRDGRRRCPRSYNLQDTNSDLRCNICVYDVADAIFT